MFRDFIFSRMDFPHSIVLSIISSSLAKFVAHLITSFEVSKLLKDWNSCVYSLTILASSLHNSKKRCIGNERERKDTLLRRSSNFNVCYFHRNESIGKKVISRRLYIGCADH